MLYFNKIIIGPIVLLTSSRQYINSFKARVLAKSFTNQAHLEYDREKVRNTCGSPINNGYMRPYRLPGIIYLYHDFIDFNRCLHISTAEFEF